MSQEINYTVGDGKAAPTLAEEAAALDAATAAQATPAVDASRPSWLPEQFKTAEDFRKSYDEGRAELTRLQQAAADAKKVAEVKPPEVATSPVPEVKPTTETPAPGTPEAAAAAAEAVRAAGVDVTPFQTEYAQTGDISDANRAKLAEQFKGQFGDQARAMVDSFIEGQRAVAGNLRNAALGEVGGQEKYTEIAQWAKASMPKAELEAFNRAVGSGDMNTTLLAMRGLKASYEKANGVMPALARGQNTVPGAGEAGPYASTKQMVDAINDPRYASDPAYRNMVMKRVQAG